MGPDHVEGCIQFKLIDISTKSHNAIDIAPVAYFSHFTAKVFEEILSHDFWNKLFDNKSKFTFFQLSIDTQKK